MTRQPVPKTWMLETAATEIASGALLGDADRAEAEVVAVVAGGDDRDDAGRDDVGDASIIASLAGSVWALRRRS